MGTPIETYMEVPAESTNNSLDDIVISEARSLPYHTSSRSSSSSGHISPGPPAKSRRTRRGDSEAAAVMKACLAVQKMADKVGTEPVDGVKGFCDNIAFRLRNFSPRLRALAYIEIEKTLFNLEFPE